VIESLVHDCVEIIGCVKSFDVATSLDALELADLIDDAEAAILRRRAMQYIVAHFDEVAAAERFHKLVGSNVYYSIIAAVYQVSSIWTYNVNKFSGASITHRSQAHKENRKR